MGAPRNTPWANIDSTGSSVSSTAGAIKTFTVPAGEQWVLNSIYAEFTASSIAGNRIPTVNILDTSSNTYLRYDGPVISSAAARNVTWAIGHVNDTVYVNGAALRVLGGEVIVPENYRVQFTDSTAVSTLDASTVRLLIERRYI